VRHASSGPSAAELVGAGERGASGLLRENRMSRRHRRGRIQNVRLTHFPSATRILALGFNAGVRNGAGVVHSGWSRDSCSAIDIVEIVLTVSVHFFFGLHFFTSYVQVQFTAWSCWDFGPTQYNCLAF
jgi:hypothetical protein